MSDIRMMGIHNTCAVLNQLEGVGGKERTFTSYALAPHSDYARSTIDSHLRAAEALGFVEKVEGKGRTGMRANFWRTTPEYREKWAEWDKAAFLHQRMLGI